MFSYWNNRECDFLHIQIKMAIIKEERDKAIKQIQILLGNHELDDAIETIENNLKLFLDIKEFEEKVIIQKSKLSSLKNDFDNNQITNDVYQVGKSQVVSALLALINQSGTNNIPGLGHVRGYSSGQKWSYWIVIDVIVGLFIVIIFFVDGSIGNKERDSLSKDHFESPNVYNSTQQSVPDKDEVESSSITSIDQAKEMNPNPINTRKEANKIPTIIDLPQDEVISFANSPQTYRVQKSLKIGIDHDYKEEHIWLVFMNKEKSKVWVGLNVEKREKTYSLDLPSSGFSEGQLVLVSVDSNCHKKFLNRLGNPNIPIPNPAIKKILDYHIIISTN